MTEAKLLSLIALEDVSCIDFVYHVIKASIIAVGYDSLGKSFKVVQVVYDSAIEKG